MAVGAPDTRNKMLTQGKWVTHGILFDVNSDRIRGESYGTLKEVASVLTENADLQGADRRPHRLGRRGSGQPRSVHAAAPPR